MTNIRYAPLSRDELGVKFPLQSGIRGRNYSNLQNIGSLNFKEQNFKNRKVKTFETFNGQTLLRYLLKQARQWTQI